MTNVRRHYATICYRDNTVVTYKVQSDGHIEVDFETPARHGSKYLSLLKDGTILRQEGYNPSEIDFCQRFLATNLPLIERMVMEDA